ncbi:D-alanyl-D-alanine carboxypeptidase [Bacteroidales bacterium OttesenSCG-928-M06]|nr:D-alanyl-D-alanine carboxypeptidase [Bacteroidales bacterium OttesenSCG-928-M06]
MKKQLLLLFFVSFFSFEYGLLLAQTENALQRFLDNPELKSATIGFEMKNISSGEIVASYNENISLTPASVNKIGSTDFSG